MKLLFDEVVRRTPETPEPAQGLANCWKIVGNTFTFTLDDARFSAGSDLTAGASAFTDEAGQGSDSV